MEKENSKPIADMKAIDAVLDSYEQKVGLDEFSESYDNSAARYMSMGEEQLSKLDPSRCSEIALVLQGLSFHVQRCYNREIARINWADACLKRLVYGRENNYRGSWDSTFYQAAREDTYTAKLLDIKRYAKQRADRLYYLSTSINNRANMFLALQRAKLNG